MKKVAVLLTLVFLISVCIISCGRIPASQTESSLSSPSALTEPSLSSPSALTEPSSSALTAPSSALTAPSSALTESSAVTTVSAARTTETVSASTVPSVVTSETTVATVTSVTTVATVTSATTETTATVAAVCYRDFGAVGDGKTDDFQALQKAHEYANRMHLPVRAEAGAVYYIGKSSERHVIEIQTDTEWAGAKFIIDDSVVGDSSDIRNLPVFRVTSALRKSQAFSISSLTGQETSLDVRPGADCLVYLEDKSDLVFIRSGLNASDGNRSRKREVLLVDAEGNISPETPLTWSYPSLAAVHIFPLDTETLTVSGGEFEIINNVSPNVRSYFRRGIEINRSHTVLQNVTQYTTGEGDPTVGAPHAGFLYIYQAAYVEVQNCCIAPNRVWAGYVSGTPGSMGYGIHVNCSTNVTFSGCTQNQSIHDDTYWGIFTSNFARNITLDNCVFSRFDAHCGVYNVTVRNCELGYQGVRFVGFGTALIENTSVTGSNFLWLRSDYGATWKGDIILRDCKFICTNAYSGSSIFSGGNDGTHDYGYTCYCPNITIDGLEIDDSIRTSGYKGMNILHNYDSSRHSVRYEKRFAYTEPEKITVKNVTTASGLPLHRSYNTYLYREVEWDTDIESLKK